jgi:polysaccharide chain length determinant protein (PEP-CTERM system associated)
MSNQSTMIRDLAELLLKEGRRRVVALGVAFSVLAIVGLMVGLVMPKKWEASAVLLAEERNILKPLMEGRAVPTTIADQKAIVTQLVLSRRILREVLTFGGWPTAKMNAQDQERHLNGLKGRIKITSPRDEMIRITYQDTERMRAYKVANKLAEIYVRESVAAKERESREAFDFIAKRTKEYGDKLTEAHQNLLAYYNGPDRGTVRDGSTGAAGAGGEEGTARSTSGLRGGVTVAQLAALRAEEATLTAQLGRNPGTPSNAESRQVEEQYRARVLQLEGEVSRMATRYTDEYPEMKRAKRDLELAKEDLRAAEHARADRDKARAAASALDNDVARAARARLDEVQRQISAATGVRRRPATRGGIATVSAVAAVPGPSTPESEVQRVGMDTTLSELLRRYEATRDVYSDLLKRRENARVSMDLDIERRGLTLRVQEAAELPAMASSMRLLHMTAIALVVAAVVPLGLLFAVVRLDPKVRSRWQIERLTRVPVLAAIPDAPLPRDKERHRRQRSLVLIMVAGVLVIYAVVFVIRQKMS